MPNELITIVAPAVRTKWWLEFHEALTKSNDVLFKMIFVGHKKPAYKLPDNFLYVYSDNVPSACVEIGFRKVDTEYVINMADDYEPRAEHLSAHLLDRLLDEHKRVESLGVKHFFVGPSFCMAPSGQYAETVPLLYDNYDHQKPILTVSPLTKTSTNRLLGGIDCKYHSMYWDTDLNMRLYAIGGQTKVMGMFYNKEQKVWSVDHNSGDFVRLTERDVTEARDSMTEIGMQTLSLKTKGFDHGVFRNEWDGWVERCSRSRCPEFVDAHGNIVNDRLTIFEDGRYAIDFDEAPLGEFQPFPDDLK